MMFSNDYPKNWGEIANAVKERAGWCCQHCGAANDRETGHVLTVHHLDGDKSNCDPSNLVALCQKCHLHIQAKYQPGQEFLPGMEPTWIS